METASLLAAPNLTLSGRCGGAAPAAASTAAAAAAAARAAAASVMPPSPGATAEASLSPAVAQALQETREKTMLWLAAELELLQRLLYKVSSSGSNSRSSSTRNSVAATALVQLNTGGTAEASHILTAGTPQQQQLQQQLLRQTRPLLTHEQPRLLPPQQQQQQQQVEGFTRALDQLLAATADTQLSVRHAAAAASQLLHLGYHVGVVLPLLAVFGYELLLLLQLHLLLLLLCRGVRPFLLMLPLLHQAAQRLCCCAKVVLLLPQGFAAAAACLPVLIGRSSSVARSFPLFRRLAALGVSLSVALEQQLQENPEQLQQHLLLHSPAAAAAATTKTVVAMTIAVARAAKSEEAAAAAASHAPHESAAADAAAAAVLLQWSESCRAACGTSASAGRPEAAAAARVSVEPPFRAAVADSSSSSTTLPRKFVAYAVSATPRLSSRNVTEDAVFREWAAAARGCAALDRLPDSVSEGLITPDGADEDWTCSSSSSSCCCCRNSATPQHPVVAAAAAERVGDPWGGQLAPQPDAAVGIGGQCM
ncbi:hypothetical protein Esti_002016 [Eimeria stiedai]